MIMVQMLDRVWTRAALHRACSLARQRGERVVLLRLQQARFPQWLGTGFGQLPPTPQERVDLQDHLATAEDYGVELEVISMQCVTSIDAVLQAAQQMNADIVFAKPARTAIPLWFRFQTWLLERQLHQEGRQFVAAPCAELDRCS